ncbi:UDP-N-acetylmuramoyl-L-alanine--D-glutamate ligase [Psychrobium sp. 1_MG-2023]|uniref:UDP-N-acetylmuramoyl-L-alanine--D-glutamate ligase n=1 Tax=Psychrobium sp. 1_MG-2023 TaxID=3062624 RepID=UPI000C345E47|nr:UDP-N-acetylmuramoyl-L-alanine--D-glutamate ligase [Psychrobium sp. 1_MG-2023]MDP2561460.1 UDP-N-acetylmuramoyl-L-alanine--D-glutamate ligase [Psychrobium sp. 1_MG-2023]PKF57727.1 UDP-N-acetylmuramoyl-L-alanine--D-glutamate ligase [Alteromonadales bacterium alter-6D02]
MELNGRQINKVAVIGLGLTGRSCVNFLLGQGVSPTLIDTREQLDTIELQQQFPDLDIKLGALEQCELTSFDLLLVSPGITVQQAVFEHAMAAGVLVWGDVELFAHFVKAPVIGITGSNGKTTVTSLLTEMANNAGVKAVAIGNIGVPVLDVVNDSSIELFVLELSSFQLETTYQLELAGATVLNISDDHMDRYDGLDDYAQAKQRIYHHCACAVVNRDDQLTKTSHLNIVSFGVTKPALDNEYGIDDNALYQGETRLIGCDELAMIGLHNQLNALAALALGQQVGLNRSAMLDTLRQFTGLAHRCELVSNKFDVRWLNDSKATNVGATLAALTGLTQLDGQLIVIAGGDTKGGDLTPLVAPFNTQVDHLIVIGRDRQLFVDLFPNALISDSLEHAVATANELAKAGDVVLLSPASASIDMFKNYMERGQHFIDAVEGLDVS